MPLKLPTLSLYIHIPWCIKKCPYCDFNSYAKTEGLPVVEYIQGLKHDLEAQREFTQARSISSIFFGGGTPSLFPSDAIKEIVDYVSQELELDADCEITLEANPGTAEYSDFGALREGGVNRLSFGAQSFSNRQLEQLGRIHSAEETLVALNKAKQAGFDNFNVDIMHSLPNQSVEEALYDLEQALASNPSHLSWYQLTIEPNTAFFSKPPSLPDEDQQNEIYRAGQELLLLHGYEQYEVSAYAKVGKRSRHNLNYWQFGDYLALGAGAHGKITRTEENSVYRFSQTRNPTDYLKRQSCAPLNLKAIDTKELPLEFMMNALRLLDGVPAEYFHQRTGLELASIEPTLNSLRDQKLLYINRDRLKVTSKGHYFLNSVLDAFLAPDEA